jgi:hypothetical protein|tara:strand:- start:184 stop:558 length:375 start_codon:yes stop_codon:yes gene_type:complete
MNNYKSVRNRLFTNSEVELKSESVELGIAQDIKKEFALARKEWRRYLALADKIKGLSNDAITALKQSRVASEKMLKNTESFKKQAKDLGVEVPRDIVSDIDSAKFFKTEGGKSIKILQTTRNLK